MNEKPTGKLMFEIRRTTNQGTFHIQLNQDLSIEHILQLCQLSENLLGTGEIVRKTSTVSVQNQQSKLGEFPVDEINMGSYVEPCEGVRIKILHFPEHRGAATRIVREATGISIFGCKDIVYGNYPCPLLTEEAAQQIMESFKRIGVYAKVERAETSTIIDG